MKLTRSLKEDRNFTTNMAQEKFNAKEAACLLLSSKLYSDYVDASSVFPGVEAEHFAEDWLRKNIPDDDRVMSLSVWRHFLDRLIERKNSRENG